MDSGSQEAVGFAAAFRLPEAAAGTRRPRRESLPFAPLGKRQQGGSVILARADGWRRAARGGGAANSSTSPIGAEFARSISCSRWAPLAFAGNFGPRGAGSAQARRLIPAGLHRDFDRALY